MYKELLVDPDIPIEYFQMIRVDAQDVTSSKSIIENIKLVQLRRHHIVVQDKYIEALSIAHDSIPRSCRVKFKIVAEFTLPHVFPDLYHITYDEQECMIL